MSSVQTPVETRVSTHHFNAERPICRAQFVELVCFATFAQSAYNGPPRGDSDRKINSLWTIGGLYG